MVSLVISKTRLVIAMMILVYATRFEFLSRNGALIEMTSAIILLSRALISMMARIIALTKPILTDPTSASR